MPKVSDAKNTGGYDNGEVVLISGTFSILCGDCGERAIGGDPGSCSDESYEAILIINNRAETRK